MRITRSLALACLTAFCIVPSFSQQFDSNFGVQLKGIGKVLYVDEAPNGDVLAVGEFDFHNNAVSGRVLRLDANGNFVSGFNKVYTDESVQKIMALPDGKMLIQGYFTKVNGNPANHLARLNADGSFDNTFSAPASNTIHNFDLQANGKIIVVDYPFGKVYRLNLNGSIDNTFTSINFVQHQMVPVHHLQVDSQDRILIGNWQKLLRLTSEGLIDNTFNSSILVHDGAIFTLAIQSDDKVLLGGSFSEFAGTSRQGLIRIEENASVDVTFNGTPGQSQTNIIEVTSDGRILTGGNDAKIYFFSSTGNLQQVVSTLPFGTIYSLKQTQDNNIIVGGWFQYINGQEQRMLAKLKSDYSCSSQFSPDIFNTAVAGRDIMAIAPNGEILLGGWDQNFVNAGNIKEPLIRITNQGAIDETFQPELDSNSMINTLEVQQNNQILVSGFLNFNGTFRTFARLKSDGTFDPSFNSGGSGTGNILEKIRFTGSDIYIAGSFTKYNETTSTSFAILKKDGQIKKTCLVFGTATFIRSFDFQSDGKIVVIGQLQMPDGTLKGIVRLNRDLTLDETFTPKDTGNYFAIKIDRENRIYVGGSWFPFLAGAILVRLDPSGELDTSFKNGQYITSITPLEVSNIKEVSLIDILPSNQIVVGGYFNQYKGVEANGIIIFDKDADTFYVPKEPLSPTSLVMHLLYHGSSVYAGGRLSFDGGKRILSLSKIKLNPQNFINPGNPPSVRLSEDQLPDLTALQWVDGTDAEDGYEIERYSESDKKYLPIATTPSNWTAFLDNTNVDSEFRYRIRSYNEKGKSEYKYTIPLSVEDKQKTDFVVAPNPAASYLNILGRGTIQTMYLINLVGQPIPLNFTNTESDVYWVDISNIPNGLYWLTLNTTEGIKRLKIVKH